MKIYSANITNVFLGAGSVAFFHFFVHVLRNKIKTRREISETN
jgi:hypothetical protein